MNEKLSLSLQYYKHRNGRYQSDKSSTGRKEANQQMVVQNAPDNAIFDDMETSAFYHHKKCF